MGRPVRECRGPDSHGGSPIYRLRRCPAGPQTRPAGRSAAHELDGQHRSLRRGQGSEFDSLREYVVGERGGYDAQAGTVRL